MLMKTVFLSAIISLSVSVVFSQQIVNLEISKPIETYYNPKTRIVLYIPYDLTGFDFDNPIDSEMSMIEVFNDDAGNDLLTVHNKVNEDQEDMVFSFYGIGDYDNNKDLQIQMELGAIPGNGATKAHIEGKIYLNFTKEGEEKSTKLKKFSMMNPDGVDTPIGMLQIHEYGSVSTDEVEFITYRLSSPDVIITSVKAIDGVAADAAKAVKELGVGMEKNEFALNSRDIESVNLEVTYSQMDKVEVPIVLDFSIGF